MVIPRSLLFKGLGLCSLCGGVGVAIHQKDNIASLLSPNSSSKITRGNLECEEPTPLGGNCVLKTGEKIFVKKGNDTTFELTSLGDGKIKVYKVGGNDGYNEGFKFLIEDNDITGSDTKKLEEFESYEIKKGDEGETDVETLKGQHYLSRKTESKEEIKKALGLPWDLPTDNNRNVENDITNENLGTIKFDGRTGATISGGTVTLTISKESSKNEFPLGYKFTFKNSGNSEATLTIGGTPISLKNGSDVDFKIKKEGSSLSLEKAWTVETLAEKVGLKKENDDYWTVGEKGLNVKQNETKETGKTKNGSPTGKIRLHEGSQGYNEGLKFEIEKGDFDLNKNGGTITVLSQFESYEITKDGDNWYLTRKVSDGEKIKELLNLPCDLPTDSETKKECTLNNDNINTIKFDDKGDGTVTSEGSPKLTIHKESGRYDYPLGYKFVFSSNSGDSTLTIGSTPIKLKEGVDVDFRIKISGDNKDTLSLEKAWTPESLMEEVGFKKENDAWVLGDGNVNVMQGENKSNSLTKSGSQNGKIKVYEEVPGYNQGFKFVIEGGDINFEADNSISKLSKYETYEVIMNSSDNYWYLSRKQTTTESIKDILGLPQDCTMPSSSTQETTCSLNSEDKLKAIKFEGKGDAESVTIADSGNSVTLKISKTSDNHFTHGYKFILESEKDVTIPQNGGTSIAIKKNTNTEFKLKESGNKLTLERAWNGSSLGAKIKLKDCDQEKKCSFGDNINVFDSDNSYVDDAAIATTSSSQKITYEENADGYNQGFKFFVSEDITLENGTGPSNGKVSAICKKTVDGGSTYQIMEKTIDGNKKWYLVKK